MTALSGSGVLSKARLGGAWALEPGQSDIRLRATSFWGLVAVKGRFTGITGNGAVSHDGQVSGSLRVAAASIDTKNAKRDKHLRSPDFFDVDNYPEITLAVDGVELSGPAVCITGTLTVRGRTRPVTIDAVASVQSESEIQVDAAVHINRADFGMTWNWHQSMSMDNTITVHAVFARR
jgi:polyisoprenoid-binding protein YceI